ncbi:serine hydrolase domain-containing protein [Longispora sp. K20-0274]|uniref:serine hydrolase domain-containing protein n=1 Tax=Longispora sp. K20-0274 TaxID=3088255 RepID=UPI00399ABD80
MDPEFLALLNRHADPAVPDVAVASLDGGTLRTASWGRPPGTLFQAASISKPVTALAALVLVKRGTLNLDEDVNLKLRSWKLPTPPDWPGRITLRHLLSHGAGLTVKAFPGYPIGTKLPDLPAVLDGRAPANTAPVRITGLPGLVPRYSGGGYTVLQQLMEDVTRTALPELVADLVLRPARMTNAQFVAPEPEVAAPGVSHGQPVPGGWRTYPELAAAGLWCTPTDLVRFAAAVQACVAGAKDALLPPQLAADLVTEQLRGWGLGIELAGTAKGRRFGHSGSNIGYRCEVTATVAAGPAIAVMTASDRGGEVIRTLLPAVRKALAWPDPLALTPGPATEPDLVPPNAMTLLPKLYAGTYETDRGTILTLDGSGWSWALTVPGQPPLPLEARSKTLVTSAAPRVDVTFRLDPSSGRALSLTLTQDGEAIGAVRK